MPGKKILSLCDFLMKTIHRHTLTCAFRKGNFLLGYLLLVPFFPVFSKRFIMASFRNSGVPELNVRFEKLYFVKELYSLTVNYQLFKRNNKEFSRNYLNL